MSLNTNTWESDNEGFTDVTVVEEKLGVKLPFSYVELMKLWNGGYLCDEHQMPIEGEVPESLTYYLGEGFWTLSSIAGVSSDLSNSNGILYTSTTAHEWGIPHKVIAFDGDGHTWLALDYRDETLDEPRVIFIESDDLNSFVIADNFLDFLSKLIPSDQVYDHDGNLIYDKKS